MARPEAGALGLGVQANEDEGIAVLGRLNLQVASLNAKLDLLDSAIVAGEFVLRKSVFLELMFVQYSRKEIKSSG